VVEFDHFKIRVVHLFPSTNEFERSPVANPIFNDIRRPRLALLGVRNIGKADVIRLILIQQGNGKTLNCDRSWMMVNSSRR
jgi:hypothetical protein